MMITDKCLFEKLMETGRKYPDYFIGWDGKILSEIKDDPVYNKKDGSFYEKCFRLDLDLVNTGISFYRTELINEVKLNPFKNSGFQWSDDEFKYADDFYFSKYFKKKMTVEYLQKGIERLPQGNFALWEREYHFQARKQVIKKFWLNEAHHAD